ncbi:MAG: hypothetical protein ACXWC4_21895 [Telluria sp.]
MRTPALGRHRAASLALALFLTAAATPAAAEARLAPPGVRPAYGTTLCQPSHRQRSADGSPDDAALRAAVDRTGSAQARALLQAVPDEVLWWVRTQKRIDAFSLPIAIHESTHIIDTALSSCGDGLAAYLFDGQTYVTEVKRSSTPPYRLGGVAVPAVFKANPVGRYQAYFVRTPELSGNDFTILLDELNGYVEGARIELRFLEAGDTYRLLQKQGAIRYDGNLGGMADMMLFVECYLKVLRDTDSSAYRRIRNSPLLIAQLSRMWTAAERLIGEASPYAVGNGGLIELSEQALGFVYQPEFINVLDDAGVAHRSASPVRRAADAPAAK